MSEDLLDRISKLVVALEEAQYIIHSEFCITKCNSVCQELKELIADENQKEEHRALKIRSTAK